MAYSDGAAIIHSSTSAHGEMEREGEIRPCDNIELLPGEAVTPNW